MASTDNNRRLQELSGSDFEMGDGQPDIRGWDVKTTNGEKIGDVEEIIFDTQSLKVRYLVVDIDDDNGLDLDEREVLVPIGMAELHDKDDDVILNGISLEQLRALPEYDDDRLDANMERQVCTALGRTGVGTSGSTTDHSHSDEFYQHDHFNDSNLYRKRLPQSTTSQTDVTGSTEAGLLGSGIGLRNRMGLVGTELDEYSTGNSLSTDRNMDTTNREGVFREEQVEDNAAVPVSWTDRDTDQQQRNQELMEGDVLTGDGIRNVQDDMTRSSQEGLDDTGSGDRDDLNRGGTSNRNRGTHDLGDSLSERGL